WFEIRLWDAASYRPLGPPAHVPSNFAFSVNLSPDGSKVVTVRRKVDNPKELILNVWDVVEGRIANPRKLAEADEGDVAFHPNGRMVMARSRGGDFHLWDVVTGELVGPALRGQKGARFVAIVFHRDGRLVALAGSDKTVQVWDVMTGQPVGSPLRHEQE